VCVCVRARVCAGVQCVDVSTCTLRPIIGFGVDVIVKEIPLVIDQSQHQSQHHSPKSTPTPQTKVNTHHPSSVHKRNGGVV
jgi:hypothetical protein